MLVAIALGESRPAPELAAGCVSRTTDAGINALSMTLAEQQGTQAALPTVAWVVVEIWRSAAS